MDVYKIDRNAYQFKSPVCAFWYIAADHFSWAQLFPTYPEFSPIENGPCLIFYTISWILNVCFSQRFFKLRALLRWQTRTFWLKCGHLCTPKSKQYNTASGRKFMSLSKFTHTKWMFKSGLPSRSLRPDRFRLMRQPHVTPFDKLRSRWKSHHSEQGRCEAVYGSKNIN